MHDPDALYHQPRCISAEKEARQRAEHLEMHRRHQARMAPILARDRRWRRAGQTVLGACAVAALILFGSVLTAVWSWLNGGHLLWLDSVVTSINVGGVATAFTVLRMALAWRKRRGGTTLGRAADTVAAVYRP